MTLKDFSYPSLPCNLLEKVTHGCQKSEEFERLSVHGRQILRTVAGGSCEIVLFKNSADPKTPQSDFFEQVLCPCEIENTGIRRILQYTHIISIKRHFSLVNTDEKVTPQD